MRRICHIHFVGIGGVGMGAIAEVLVREGYTITGSDLKKNKLTDHLEQLGVKIYEGQRAEQINGADVVVRSTDIQDDNPELQEARLHRIPIVPRAQMLGELMRFRYGISAAGTHGKTTTTSLIASVLLQGGVDPSFVIGGRLNSIGTNAHLGSSPYLVVEADESDASFLHLPSMIAVVTNIDLDHMGTYQWDENNLKKTFIEFLHNLPFYGLAVLCIDDPRVRDILPFVERPILTYGLSEDADVQAIDIEQSGFSMEFICHCRTRQLGEKIPFRLNLAGVHNVQNALAAIAVGLELGVDVHQIQTALAEFRGVGRRMQSYGWLTCNAQNFQLYDDYGHHPQEVKVTLRALREACPGRRTVMIFQPHRYTRTRDLFEDFVSVLSEVDVLIVLEIYPAREKPIAGIDSRTLCHSIRQRGQVDPIFVKDVSELLSILPNVIQQNDVVMTQGAGDVGNVPAILVQNFG